MLINAPQYIALSYIKKDEPRKALRLYRRFSPMYNCLGRGCRAMIAHNIALCYVNMGERQEAIEWINKATPLMKNANRRRLVQFYAMDAALSAFYHAEDGELQQAELLAEEARSNVNPKSRMEPYVNYLLAVVAFYTESFDEAETASKVLVESAKEPPAEIKAGAYSLLGSCAYYQGRFEEALQNQILAEKSGVQSPRLQSIFLANQIIDAVEIEDMVAAQQAEAKLIPLLQKLEEAMRPFPYRALSTLALARGDLDRALDYAERCYNQHATTRGQANSLYLQASVYAQRKNYVRALQLIQEAETYPNFTLYRERLANLRHEVEAVGTVTLTVETSQPLNQIGR